MRGTESADASQLSLVRRPRSNAIMTHQNCGSLVSPPSEIGDSVLRQSQEVQ